ncbi:MAG: hypothetical protein QF471_05040, partial [Phycisphaerales bacterium]|nr:hypothetical protein [Phycisphaerales bacterium]
MRTWKLAVLAMAVVGVAGLSGCNTCKCRTNGVQWQADGRCACGASNCTCASVRSVPKPVPKPGPNDADGKGQSVLQPDPVIPPKPTPAQVAHVHLDECQMVVLPGP